MVDVLAKRGLTRFDTVSERTVVEVVRRLGAKASLELASMSKQTTELNLKFVMMLLFRSVGWLAVVVMVSIGAEVALSILWTVLWREIEAFSDPTDLLTVKSQLHWVIFHDVFIGRTWMNMFLLIPYRADNVWSDVGNVFFLLTQPLRVSVSQKNRRLLAKGTSQTDIGMVLLTFDSADQHRASNLICYIDTYDSQARWYWYHIGAMSVYSSKWMVSFLSDKVCLFCTGNSLKFSSLVVKHGCPTGMTAHQRSWYFRHVGDTAQGHGGFNLFL